MNTKPKREYLAFDFLLFAAVIGVAIFGIVMIGSATHIRTVEVPAREYTMQKVFCGIGVVLLLAAAFVDYHFISKFFIPIFLANLLLLVLVFLLDSGGSANVSRWLIVSGVGIQPSEFAKIFQVLFLAKLLEKFPDAVKRFLPLCAVVGVAMVPAVLIMIQPALSASLVVVFIVLAMIFAAGIRYRYCLLALVIAVPLGTFFYRDIMRDEPILIDKIKIITAYQIENRIKPFLDPDPKSDEYYQTNLSIQAIGSGLLSGKGLYQGKISQSNLLPHRHNDFIFSVVGEELGFLGAAALVAVMIFIVFKCLLIAFRAIDLSGRLICVGVAAMLGFQVFVHVGVGTGLLPNTGMPFPFVSSGGSSLLVSMTGIGLVLNVGMTKTKSFFEG